MRCAKKAVPNQAASHLENETAASQCCMVRSGGVFQQLQMGFHSRIVDPQKLVGGSHHVDAVGLTLGTLPVHELVDRFIQRRGLQVDAHDKKQRPAQRRRTDFAHALVPAGHITGIVWRSIQSSVGYERFLGIKAAHIPNFSYELRSQSRTYAEHIHDNRIFRQLGRQCLHFPPESSECDRSCPELGYSLFYEQFCCFGLWHDIDMPAGLGVNRASLCLTKVVAMFLAPMLVFVCECPFGFLADATAMPKFSYEVHPFLTPICTGGTAEQTVYIGKYRIQQRDQIVLQNRLHLGILPVLTVAVLQQQPRYLPPGHTAAK